MLITDQVATAPCTDPIQERSDFEAKPLRSLRRTHPLPRGGSDCIQWEAQPLLKRPRQLMNLRWSLVTSSRSARR